MEEEKYLKWRSHSKPFYLYLEIKIRVELNHCAKLQASFLSKDANRSGSILSSGAQEHPSPTLASGLQLLQDPLWLDSGAPGAQDFWLPVPPSPSATLPSYSSSPPHLD